MKRRILALLLACVLVLALAACGSTSTSSTPSTTNTEPKTETKTETPSETKTETTDIFNDIKTEETEQSFAPETLNIAMTVNMGDLSPFAISNPGRNTLRFFTYEYLIQFTSPGQTYDQMEWQLAKDIQKVDDTTYVVEIYDYIVDAIGNPVKASDVAFCFNTLAESGSTTRVTKALDHATALDDTHVEIGVTSNQVGVFEYICFITMIVSQKTYEEYKDQMINMPITTGPYQVTECVDGSYYIITKNENYWQKPELANYYAKQPVESMKVNIITEQNQASIALQTGEVDLITSVKPNQLVYFMNPDGSNVEGFSVASVPATTPVSMFFNMSQGPEGDMFRDNLALRQAIFYAVNPNDIVSIAYSGNAMVDHDLGMDSCGDFNPKWAEEDYHDFDLDKAKGLLAEAGYADPSTLTIRFIASSDYAAAAQILQAQIMELGVTVDLQVLDSSLFATTLQDAASWDLAIHKKGTEGLITACYDGILLRNKSGVGANNFIVDDKLEELLLLAHENDTHTEEVLDELHYYVKDNAIAYGLFSVIDYEVARAGIEPVIFPVGSWAIPNCAAFTG